MTIRLRTRNRIQSRKSAHAARIAGWTDRRSPSLDDIRSLASSAFSLLPEQFRMLCADIVIRVEEFPDDSALAELNIDNPFDLLGLFQGQGLAQRDATPYSGQLPNTIFLYRRPILDYWACHDETLGAIVTHVLIHEIGHHFGLSDEDMDRIEQADD